MPCHTAVIIVRQLRRLISLDRCLGETEGNHDLVYEGYLVLPSFEGTVKLSDKANRCVARNAPPADSPAGMVDLKEVEPNPALLRGIICKPVLIRPLQGRSLFHHIPAGVTCRDTQRLFGVRTVSPSALSGEPCLFRQEEKVLPDTDKRKYNHPQHFTGVNNFLYLPSQMFYS